MIVGVIPQSFGTQEFRARKKNISIFVSVLRS